jgi:peptidoglycan/LPS O-acetylase OafA/YrhL
MCFVRDYARVPWDWSTGHSWSLSIEEQFYLLWPCVLVLLGRKKALRLALWLLVLVPVIRTVSHGIWNHGLADLFSFHTNADSLMTGCTLALIESKSWFREAWRKIESPLFALFCVTFLVGISPALYLRFASWYWLTLGMSLNNFAIAYAMFYVIRNPEGITGRILNWKPVVHVGVLSYSLYLWQEPFLSPDTKHILLSLVAAFACAELSWYLVERPSRWVRDWIAMSCQALLVQVQR